MNRRGRFEHVGIAVLLAGSAVACGDADVPGVGPTPVGVGPGFDVHIEPSQRLVVASADGRVLLDGLAPAAIAEGAPPLAGFAVREATTAYEMQFGAFKPTETGGTWRAATRLALGGSSAASAEGAGPAPRIDLLDGTGALLATITASSPDPGHLVFDVAPGAGPERRFSWGFACDEGDHFAGFGSQTWDVDHRGQTVPAFVQEQGIGKDTTDDYAGAWFLVGRRHSSHIPIPQYLARRGYVLTAETPERALFALCSERGDAARIELDLPVRVHVFDGPTPAQALERSSATFGRPRMPPRVAFAPWLDAVFGSENVRRIAQKLRDSGVPSSVIWTEDWRGGDWKGEDYRLNEEWEVDPALYPDAQEVAADLHALGFDWHVYFNPFVYEGSKAWDEVAPNGWLVKRTDGKNYTFTGAKFSETGLIDLENADARAWAVGKMRAAMALGADGWMNDFAEWLPTDGVTAAGPSGPVHNLYPVRWQEVAREAIDGAPDGAERLFFGRSGWLGTPALADVIWAGDQRTTMDRDDGMPTVVPIGIGLGVVGVSTYGHDIAGYQSATNPGSTKELFFRWTELGAWSPVMRTHHGAQPNLCWSWEKDDETLAHFRRYARLHMALVPYLEGLARAAADTGFPIWRGLALEHPAEAEAWGIDDEVLVGPGILIAPVMTEGATSREVWLPPGLWYPWAAGARIEVAAAERIEATAPLEEIPVYAAAGAIVPTYPDGVMTLVRGTPEVPDASSIGDDRVLYAFAGAGGSFTEAAGLSYTLEEVATNAGAPRWQGADLAACASPPVAPCVEESADAVTAHVIGDGTLEVPAANARVTADGGSAERRLVIVVRR